MKLFSLIRSGSIHFSKKTKVIPKEEFSELVSAKEIVDAAKKDIHTLLEESKEQAAQMQKDAYQEGLQKGLEQFNAQLLYMNQEIKQLRIDLQQQILPLALKTAKKIVSGELKLNPDAIVDIVHQNLKPVVQAQNIKIFVNKGDIPYLEKKKEEFKSLFERLDSLTIDERPDIEPGSVVIETEAGIINATLENQWRALEAAFENFAKKKG